MQSKRLPSKSGLFKTSKTDVNSAKSCKNGLGLGHGLRGIPLWDSSKTEQDHSRHSHSHPKAAVPSTSFDHITSDQKPIRPPRVKIIEKCQPGAAFSRRGLSCSERNMSDVTTRVPETLLCWFEGHKVLLVQSPWAHHQRHHHPTTQPG